MRSILLCLLMLAPLTVDAATRPAAPRNLVAIPGNRSVTLSWEAGSADVTSYRVLQATTSGDYHSYARGRVVGTTATIPRLPNGETLYFKVVARNAAGSSPRSNEAAAAPGAAVCEAYVGPALGDLHHYEGLTHEHSAYSDGDPHSIPDDYYRIGKERGYDFVAGSEHSDSLDAGNFAALHASCDPSSGKFDPTALEYCFLNPSMDKLFKWRSTQAQARTRSSGSFLAIRGFEWTSDVFGHINVFFSQNFTNAKDDLGYALTMQTFWDWFTRDPSMPGPAGAPSSPVPFGGGADGLAVFNHPHDKCLTLDDPTGTTVPWCDWNGYAFVPAAAQRMFGIEAYNDSNRNDRYLPFIAHALDVGWRLSFIGSEDEHFAQYAVEHRPKTVTVARTLTDPGFKEAWLARRTYALTPGQHLRIAFDAQGRPMGSELRCGAGKSVPLHVAVSDRAGLPIAGSLQLFTDGGTLVDQLQATTGTFQVPVVAGKHWYFVRVHGADGGSVAYVAPVWIEGK